MGGIFLFVIQLAVIFLMVRAWTSDHLGTTSWLSYIYIFLLR